MSNSSAALQRAVPPGLRAAVEAAVLDSAAIYVARPGRAREFLYASPAVAAVLGCCPEQLLADPDLWAGMVDPRDLDEVLRRERSRGASGRAAVEYRVHRPDGRVVWVLEESVLSEDADHGLLVRGSLTDVTERNHERALLDAHDAVVARLSQGGGIEGVLVTVAGLIEDVTGATECRIEAETPQADGLRTQPDVAVVREPGLTGVDLVAPDGERLGRLVLRLAEGDRHAMDSVVDRAARLATMALGRAAEQRRLGESVALLAAALESTEDGILVVDSTGRTAGYNQKFTDMWHIDAELAASKDDARMIGYVLSQLVDPDSFVAEVMALYGSTTQTSFDELQFHDGRVFERYSQPQVVDGRAVGRVWSFRDVTAKRRLQQDLELFGAVATAANSASTVDGALEDTLAAVCRYTGWVVGCALLVPADDSGALVHAAWHGEVDGSGGLQEVFAETSVDAQDLPALVLASGQPQMRVLAGQAPETTRAQRAAQHGLSWMCAFPILARNEVVGVLEFAASTPQGCDERLLSAMRQVGSQVGRVVERDRSERGLARHALELERLTRELDSVLNSAGEGIYGVDLTGTITFVNEAAARLLHRPRESMVGRPESEVMLMDPVGEHVGAVEAPVGEAGGRLVTGRHRRTDGSSFDSELSTAPVLEDGRVVGSVAVLRDISERRAVDRLKDEFISMISHELRTPLTSIRGALGLLAIGAEGDLDPRAARMVQVATTSTERLIRLINDILDVERMAAGKLAIRLQPTSLRALLCSATEEMAGLAESSGVLIEVTPGDDAAVEADPDRVLQTLGNLLANAVKFSPPGATVELSATVLDRHVRFDISDVGVGIPQDQLELVFQPFLQVDGSDSRRQGGTGLGLAICRGLVERHGGRIWASRNPDHGTTLSFTLLRAFEEVTT